MEKTTVVAAGFALVFVAGFELGGRFVQWNISKRLHTGVPLMENAFASVIKQAIENNWDGDQIEKALNDELEFFKIVME